MDCHSTKRSQYPVQRYSTEKKLQNQWNFLTFYKSFWANVHMFVSYCVSCFSFIDLCKQLFIFYFFQIVQDGYLKWCEYCLPKLLCQFIPRTWHPAALLRRTTLRSKQILSRHMIIMFAKFQLYLETTNKHLFENCQQH